MQQLVEFFDLGGFDGGRAVLARRVFFSSLAVGEYASKLFAVMIRNDNSELVVFAKGLAAGAPLFSGEFHCGKGIMSSHGEDQKATSTEFHGAPMPLRAR